jgi:aspartyl-tRNA(Asn)/glutamyl-tRNA(Gln) amidotransferase subunit A
MSRAREIVDLGVVDLAARFRDGSLSPTTVTEFYLSQIAILNPRIHAVLDVYVEEAHIAAKVSAQRYKSGKPLSDIDGVPIGVKANIGVKGHVCHGGIKAYEKHIAPEDADVVAQLKKAGAIIIGSLNMEEGALGAATDNPWFGKTYNPLKSGYTPGGSSGGSAAAVASGMMPAALGTDTMGSVRIPSAYCGLVCHKPTNGLVSMKGIMPLSPTLDCVGPHTRSVADTRMILNVLSPANANDPNPRELTIGRLDWAGDVVLEKAIEQGFEKAISVFDKAGASIVDIRFDGYDFSKARRAGLLISEIEGAQFHLDQYERNPDGFSEHFQSLLTWGVKQNSEKVEAAFALIVDQTDRANAIFDSCDVLIAPTTPQNAFKFGDPIPANQADFTAFANFAGLPATAVPVKSNGLPASVQIIGPKGKDGLTLAVAQKLEEFI